MLTVQCKRCDEEYVIKSVEDNSPCPWCGYNYQQRKYANVATANLILSDEELLHPGDDFEMCYNCLK